MGKHSAPAPTRGMTRTQDEIVARIVAVTGDDFFGFKKEVLVMELDFDHAQQFLKAGTTAAEWAAARAEDKGDLFSRAAGYLDFAFGKAHDERGLSASRSVQKLGEYAWLLGEDDLAERMGSDDEYAPYGLPLLRAFAETFDLPVVSA